MFVYVFSSSVSESVMFCSLHSSDSAAVQRVKRATLSFCTSLAKLHARARLGGLNVNVLYISLDTIRLIWQ